jgi:hypothetical protein
MQFNQWLAAVGLTVPLGVGMHLLSWQYIYGTKPRWLFRTIAEPTRCAPDAKYCTGILTARACAPRDAFKSCHFLQRNAFISFHNATRLNHDKT